MPMPAPKLAADFRPRVERLWSAFGREIDDGAGRLLVERSVLFAELVAAWNERIDLTAARDPDELVDLLFADAAAILRDRMKPSEASAGGSPDRERWLDVGSGVGAPGVAIALLQPDLEMTLVEPRAKRVAFLRTLLHRIERPDVAVERSRSETLAELSCDVAVSRATLPPAEWLREGARLARREVWVFLARDPPPACDGLEIVKSVEYRWPLTDKTRRAVCFRRVRLPGQGENYAVIEK
jgi:16S rRNA (guanine527-N7)-methyltransferase